ncbi:MAG: 1-deoxy-D-xylulose-5-phosphate synthase, partial [Thermoleophilia bacterium]|nr:1-deoxy-D-xylulose-5-phosphate synthase [Thermoleophilia bacterium]
FPCRFESEHDVVGTGHASTSVSYGLGLVEAARLAGEARGRVCCVIGDGALTGGTSFEALNNAGHLRSPLVVLLNDNQMSIKPNVGALQLYLNRLRMDPTLTRLREDLEHTLQRVPAIGERAYALGKDVKESMKALILPGMLFEELGFAYLGVIDGHDLKAVREALRQAFETERPVVVHARTIKGKGYEPAEASPDQYHGTGPFFLGNGEKKDAAGAGGGADAGADAAAPAAATAAGGANAPAAGAGVGVAAAPVTTYTQAFGEALVRLAEEDLRIVAITAAMTQGTGLDVFEERYPERFYDVGIAEEHAAVFAAGLALGGLRPVVAVYSTFLQRAFDMLVQDVGLQELPVVFAVDRAGIVGDDGPTHHGAFDLSYLRMIPGMTVMAPSSQLELQRMLATALTLDGPAALRYPRGMAAPFAAPGVLEPVEVGRGEVLAEGADVALIGIGTGVGIAAGAAALLRARGLKPTVVDARFVKPLDCELLGRLAATHRLLVTVEENVLAGGFGSAVLEEVAPSRVEVLRFGLPDAFVPHGDRARLLRDAGLTAETVAAAVAEAVAVVSADPSAGPAGTGGSVASGGGAPAGPADNGGRRATASAGAATDPAKLAHPC